MSRAAWAEGGENGRQPLHAQNWNPLGLWHAGSFHLRPRPKAQSPSNCMQFAACDPGQKNPGSAHPFRELG